MPSAKTLIEQAYSAFNKRDIDAASALMTEDVSWPRPPHHKPTARLRTSLAHGGGVEVRPG
jgi:ketosteroid isomerase-like protein